MKILLLSHEYPPIGGGVATKCANLAKGFASFGHQVTIITVRSNGDARDKPEDGIRIIRVNAARKRVDTSTLLEMFSYLRRAIQYADALCINEKFDICIAFCGIPSGPAALHLKRKFHLPYIISFSGGDIPGAQKRFGVLYKLLTPFIHRIWRNAKSLVANSDGLRNRAFEFDSSVDIHVITNGVDSDYYCSKKEYELDDGIRMLFVSRLIEGKGLQYVIPYMAEINRKTGRHVMLTVVGDGPYRNELESMSQGENAPYVLFAGRKTQSELVGYYEQANLFILPSQSEGMPNVVLEAMAMGLPVVMTDCEGSKELIDNNGVITPICTFVEELIALCKNDGLLNAYSVESRERAVNLFSWQNKADEYVSLFT